MTSLLNSQMDSLKLFQSLSHEEQILYASIIRDSFLALYDEVSRSRSITLKDINDIINESSEIIDIFLDLELIDYLEDILQIRSDLNLIANKL